MRREKKHINFNERPNYADINKIFLVLHTDAEQHQRTYMVITVAFRGGEARGYHTDFNLTVIGLTRLTDSYSTLGKFQLKLVILSSEWERSYLFSFRRI